METLSKELTNLVLCFTAEMNGMEVNIRDKCLQDTDKQTDWFIQFEKHYLTIIEKYCTSKKRVFERSGYSLEQPYYHGINHNNDITVDFVDDKKALITLKFNSANTGAEQYQFVLFKKKGVWKIDSVKRWSNWKKKWVSHIL